MKIIQLTTLFSFLLTFSAHANHRHGPVKTDVLKERPKLLLVIVVDQLRADYLTRFHKQLLPAKRSKGRVGGFQYLMQNGAYFPFARLDIVKTLTGPGHSMALTGSFPRSSGIVSNMWFDMERQEKMYCVEDQSQDWVGGKKTKKRAGSSPQNLNGTTVGDELKLAGYPSRVISIAVKDRAAILMGGQKPDAAIWFDKNSYSWVSSRYYFRHGRLPDWVNRLNQDLQKEKDAFRTWSEPEHETGISAHDAMPSMAYRVVEEIGPKFPHKAKGGAKAYYLPYGMELSMQAGLKAMDRYKLGQNNTTDLLAIGLSSFDYLGHAFGPNSLQMESAFLTVDAQLSTFLSEIKKRLPGGLRDVVIALTGDHGSSPNPTWLKHENYPGGKVDTKRWRQEFETKLNKKFGKLANGESWIAMDYVMDFYLNRRAIKKKGVKLNRVRDALKKLLLKKQEVLTAFTYAELEKHKLPTSDLGAALSRSFYPGRSPDVTVIVKPFYIYGTITATHITHYNYDNLVPLMISGRHIKPGLYTQQTQVVNLAPTLSLLSGTLPPAMSEGRPLSEIFRR